MKINTQHSMPLNAVVINRETLMKILVCGATGFVGRHLTQALRDAGHTVIRAVRHPSDPGDIKVDFCKDTTKEIWLPRLNGIKVVINTVGVLRDSANTPCKAACRNPFGIICGLR